MSQSILVVGCWHLGSVIGACLAKAGNNVTLWDQSTRVAESWKEGNPPLFEPGLDTLTKEHWKKNLNWCDSLATASNNADWIILSYDTPINEKDEVQLDVVEEGFQAVLKAGISKKTRFLLTAQLPVGTSTKYRKLILKHYPDWTGFLTYQPEDLRLGEAIKSFEFADRIALGTENKDPQFREMVVKEYRQMTGNQTTKINTMSLESAEMVKHALNSFLATCVVFANELSETCEKTGADAWDVVTSLKQDSRVGSKAFLRPGLGFSGGTLARDVRTLSTKLDKSEASNFFSCLYEINRHRNDWILSSLEDQIGSLKGKKITLLGVTYKPFTSTVRRSPALDIALLLKQKGAEVHAIDPMADLNELTAQERQALPFQLESSANKAFEKATAAIVVTEWPQFLELDWPTLEKLMVQKVIIDSKNLFGSKPLPSFLIRVPGKAIRS